MMKKLSALVLCLVLILSLLPGALATTEISAISLSGLTTPAVGQTPAQISPFTANTQGISFYAVDWYDVTAGAFLESSDTFLEGHAYTVQIWVEAQSGYAFKCVNDSTPAVTATVDGKTLKVTKAYEYKAFAMVVLSYDFAALSQAPAHTHTPSAWRSNQAYHYTACTQCGEFLEQGDHTGGVATCAEKGVCAVCGYAYLETTENHTPDTSKWIPRGDMYHYHKCTLCGAHEDIEDHRWSPKHHPIDAKTHAYQCADCKGYDTAKPHNPGPAATNDTPQTCKDCGYILAPAIDHTHKLTLVAEVAPTCTQPGVNAYYTCDGCSLRFSDEQGKQPLAEDADLTIPPQGHQISNGWDSDETNHWRVCAVCKEAMTETEQAHELQEGKCATCGYSADPPKSPEPQPEKAPAQTPKQEERPGLPWWALALIAVAAAGGGIGAGVLILKLSKKRKE